MIIEWNAHIFSRDIYQYPFSQRAVYRPDGSCLSDDPLSVYLERMRLEGIDRAVLVHPEPYGDDHRLILDCLEKEPNILRATSLFYPKDPDAPKKLKDLVQQQPRIVGTRFHAHRGKESYLDTFNDLGVRALWEKAGELGLVIELHIGPNYAKQVGAVVRDYPSFPVLIDHLAEPNKGSPVEYADVLELARFDQVYMKLSGLNHFSTNEPLFLDVKPFTKLVIEAFGPDHMVWGSGTPEIVDVHLEHLSKTERGKVKGGNLKKLLAFD